MSTQQHSKTRAVPDQRWRRCAAAALVACCAAGGAGVAIALKPASATVEVTRPFSMTRATEDPSAEASRTSTSEPMPLATSVRFWTTTTGCIATKIGARRFLTAAHCVDDLSVGARILLAHRMDGRPAKAGAHHSAVVTAIQIHPSYAPSQGLDLALVDLAQNSDHVAILDFDAIDAHPFEAGAKALLIGSGCDRVPSERERARQVELIAAPRASSPDGDAWDDWFERFIVSFTPSPLACPGNSGAPVFHMRSGRWWLVGVNKGIERNQGSTVITRIAPALPWLSASLFTRAHRT